MDNIGRGHYSAYHHDYNNLHTYQKHECFCCQHLVLADTSFCQSDRHKNVTSFFVLIFISLITSEAEQPFYVALPWFSLSFPLPVFNQDVCVFSLICESHSVVSDSLQSHGLYSPWNSPGKNTGEGSLSLLQQIFPTQESNWGLLHCRWTLYQLSYQGSTDL